MVFLRGKFLVFACWFYVRWEYNYFFSRLSPLRIQFKKKPKLLKFNFRKYLFSPARGGKRNAARQRTKNPCTRTHKHKLNREGMVVVVVGGEERKIFPPFGWLNLLFSFFASLGSPPPPTSRKFWAINLVTWGAKKKKRRKGVTCLPTVWLFGIPGISWGEEEKKWIKFGEWLEVGRGKKPSFLFTCLECGSQQRLVVFFRGQKAQKRPFGSVFIKTHF